MRTVFKLFSVLCIALFLFSSCEKEEKIEAFDPVTHPNFDRFHCKINGEWFVANCTNDPSREWDLWNYKPCKPYTCKADPNDHYVNVWASLWAADENLHHTFTIRLNYERLGEPHKLIYRGISFTGGDCKEYALDTTKYNYVTVNTLDEDSRRVKGVFEFWVVNYPISITNNVCEPDTFHITEGYFNLRYSNP